MKRLVSYFVVCFVIISFFGCTEKSKTKVEPTKEIKETKMSEKAWVAPEKVSIDKEKKYSALIKTSKGDIVCELYAKDAPMSVTNFKYLADNDFYKGLVFHRVVPEFVIQGGDPTGTGRGGPGYTIPAEIGKPHKKGALAWARTGDEVNPERRSSGSQFYITHKPVPFLDGAYTVFGETVEGMEIVDKIEEGDEIIDVVITESEK